MICFYLLAGLLDLKMTRTKNATTCQQSNISHRQPTSITNTITLSLLCHSPGQPFGTDAQCYPKET